MRRLLAVLIPVAILVLGCHSSEHRKADESSARSTAAEAWGSDFESGRYDILRTLSKSEQEKLDADLSKKAGREMHSSGSIYTANAAPDRVVDEIHKLSPGSTLSFCRTWHTEKKSGDVVETGATPPSRPVPFSVVTRDKDGKLHGSRLEAMSHEEAHAHR